MNPNNLRRPERIRQLLEVLSSALETHDHNETIEAQIKQHGDDDGMLRRQYRQPQYDIHSMLIIAQVTDNETDPTEEETYHIQEGGPVALMSDGDKVMATPFRECGSVLCW